MQVVGPIDVVAARVPLVQVDAPEVDDPQQRRHVLDHREVDDVARAVIDRADLDPVGPRRRRALHEEELAGGAVRVALHDHRAIADVRQQHVGDVGVVLEQIALGEPELRPEQLAQVREADLLAVDGQRRRCPDRGDQRRGCMRQPERDRDRSADAPLPQRRQLRRPRPVPDGAGDRHVLELDARRWPVRSSRPPRLMSPRPTKSIGKPQPLAEDADEHVDVLRRRDAAEQHDSQSAPISPASARALRSSGRR